METAISNIFFLGLPHLETLKPITLLYHDTQVDILYRQDKSCFCHLYSNVSSVMEFGCQTLDSFLLKNKNWFFFDILNTWT